MTGTITDWEEQYGIQEKLKLSTDKQVPIGKNNLRFTINQQKTLDLQTDNNCFVHGARTLIIISNKDH